MKDITIEGVHVLLVAVNGATHLHRVETMHTLSTNVYICAVRYNMSFRNAAQSPLLVH